MRAIRICIVNVVIIILLSIILHIYKIQINKESGIVEEKDKSSECESEKIEGRREEINNNIDLIYCELVLTHSCITFYNQMKAIKKNHPDEYKKGENFLNSVSIAYDHLIIITLSKIFDRNGQKASLSSVINNCVEDHLISEEESAKIRSGLEEYKEVIKSIHIFRHKYFAHTDKQYDYIIGKLLENRKFDLCKFDELIKSVISLLTNVKSYINQEQYSFKLDLLSGYDLYELLGIE